jgi:hypothetical protein
MHGAAGARRHLDIGIQQLAAHWRRLRKRMDFVAHHFSVTLRDHADG